jgi:hypothetical protein
MKIPYCLNAQNKSLCTTDSNLNTGTKKKTVSDKMLYSHIVNNSTYKPVNPTTNQTIRPF